MPSVKPSKAVQNKVNTTGGVKTVAIAYWARRHQGKLVGIQQEVLHVCRIMRL